MSDFGILVFSDGKQNRDEALFDSSKGRMNINMRPDLEHLKIIDNLAGGTAFGPSSATVFREVLWSKKHKLPFTPEVYLYIFIKSYNGSYTAPQANAYAGQIFRYDRYDGALATDKIFLEVDKDEARLVHTFTDFGQNYGEFSKADKYLLRLKYYITSNNSGVSSYTYKDVF